VVVVVVMVVLVEPVVVVVVCVPVDCWQIVIGKVVYTSTPGLRGNSGPEAMLAGDG
jgi:hypothetical protein